jgi:acid phosphatase
MKRAALFGAVFLLVFLYGCGLVGHESPDKRQPFVREPLPATTIPQQSPAPLPSATAQATTAPDLIGIKQVVIYVGENHSRAQVKAGAPKIWAYAKSHGYLGKHLAAIHPSLGNYIAMLFGNTFSIKDDRGPSSHKLKKPDVLSGAVKAGRTAKQYNESMGGGDNCRQSDRGAFRVKHNPWNYSTLNRALCEKGSVTYAQFGKDIDANNLPNISFVVPNICNDAHDCSLKTFDNWVDANVKRVNATPAAQAGDVLQVITWDEDNRNAGNEVLTVMIHPSIEGVVAPGTFTHYSITRMLADMGHSPRIEKAATAPDMLTPFNLTVE